MIPELKEAFGANPVKSKFTNLADFLSGLLNIVFYLAIFLAFFWLIWGSFQYMFAQGEKEKLAKARERMKWAVIGLGIVLMSYSLARFASEIFPPGKGGLPF